MMDEIIRLARQQSKAETKKPSFGFVSEISGIFSQVSSHDRTSRKRERIRQDLVRIHFDTEPASNESAKQAFAAQLGRILRLD